MNTTTITSEIPKGRIRPMDVLWGAWVKNVKIDQRQQSIDIIGIYDEIRRGGRSDFPFTIDLLAIVAYEASLSEANKTFQLTLEILDLDKPIFSITEDLILPNFLDAKIRWYQDYYIENVVIREPSDYLLYILVNGQEKQTIPLHVYGLQAIKYDYVRDATTKMWEEDAIQEIKRNVEDRDK